MSILSIVCMSLQSLSHMSLTEHVTERLNAQPRRANNEHALVFAGLCLKLSYFEPPLGCNLIKLLVGLLHLLDPTAKI